MVKGSSYHGHAPLPSGSECSKNTLGVYGHCPIQPSQHPFFKVKGREIQTRGGKGTCPRSHT